MDRCQAAGDTRLIPEFLQRGIGLTMHPLPQILQRLARIGGRMPPAVRLGGQGAGLPVLSEQCRQARAADAEQPSDLGKRAVTGFVRFHHSLSHIQGDWGWHAPTIDKVHTQTKTL